MGHIWDICHIRDTLNVSYTHTHKGVQSSHVTSDQRTCLLKRFFFVCVCVWPAAGDHGVTAPIDVHLMVSPVDRIVGDFIDAGVSLFFFSPVDRIVGDFIDAGV